MDNESRKKASYSSSSSSSSSSADSYIGSFISLTSKYEIRYEGVLCYLNPQDSTLGLKDVRSYGTEGRKKDGPQIPPSDKLYEYILFRGGDIKDLDVKSSAPSQKVDPIHNDPAIIQQSHFAVGPSSSSNSASFGGGSLTNIANPSTLPPYQSGTQMRPWGPTQTTQSANVASFPMPMYDQGYNGASSSSIPSAPRLPTPSVPMSSTIAPFVTPFQNPLQAALTQALPMSATITPFVTTLQNPLQAALTQASPNIGFPNVSHDMNIIDAPIGGKAGSDPASVISVQPLPSSASTASDSTSGFLKPTPTLLSPDQLTQFRPPVLYPSQKPFHDQKIMGTLNSTASISNSSSSVTNPVVQEPLLPLPLSAQQSRYSEPQFTDEFDFEAMNEKFKKDEVWGHLGNPKQRDEAEGVDYNAVGQNLGEGGVYGSVPKLDPKPAYNKDEFFDTISCNSIARGGHNKFSERMRMDTETFGNFQQRPHLGYGGYGVGRGESYRGSFNWGRGYNYGGRGRGGHFRI